MLNSLRQSLVSQNKKFIALFVVSVLCLITALVLYWAVLERQQAMLAPVKEDTVWATHQLDRESLKLKTSLMLWAADKSKTQLEDAQLRFDILYSRLSVVTKGEMGETFQKIPEASKQLEEIRAAMDEMDLLLFGPDVEGSTHRLVDRAEYVLIRADEIILQMLEHRATEKSSARDLVLMLFSYLGAIILLLTASMAVMIHMLARQIAFSQQSHQKTLKLASELEVVAEEAKAANRSKSEFLATMSHELRTPMNGIIGMAAVLQGTPLSEAQKKHLEVIQHSSKSLLEILNDILDISKMEAGRMELHRDTFALRPLIGSVVNLFRHTAKEKGLRLLVKLDSNVAVAFEGDAGRLRQVLINLIGNAIKFTDQGSITLRVKADNTGAGLHSLLFEIEDTGVGISKEAQPRMFNTFSQADSSTARHYGGTGLGLAICKRIVELMEGEIGFESVEGTGTTFWFCLSLPSVSDGGAPIEQPVHSEAPVEMSRETKDGAVRESVAILVVEDNTINQQVVLGLLAQLGHRADIASDGAEALEMIDRGEYDLILMDMQMPVMDGLEATRRLRQLPTSKRNTPVVALTANAMHEDRKRCEAVGMNDFLPKPIEPDQLKEVISRWQPSGLKHDVV